LFTGEYRHTIDAKGRVAVPARFRADLEKGAHVSRWIDNCVAIFPDAEWQKLADGVADLRVADSGARAFSRFIFLGAYEVELDKQGRLVLPAALREFAQLGSEVIVAGAGQHIELWPPERWAQYNAELSNPEALAARIGDLGI
jgi:MraZ protein